MIIVDEKDVNDCAGVIIDVFDFRGTDKMIHHDRFEESGIFQFNVEIIDIYLYLIIIIKFKD